MKLSDIIPPSCRNIQLSTDSIEAVVKALAQALANERLIETHQISVIVDKVTRLEARHSCVHSVGAGGIILSIKEVSAKKFVGVLGKAENFSCFKTIDSIPIRRVCLLIAPDDNSLDLYSNALSFVARMLQAEGAKE